MDFLISNWMLVIAAIAVIAVAAYTVCVFVKRPTSEQLLKVKEWLLYAVVSAEKELGSGTGQVKLRYVYDMFIARFPSFVKIIPFELFSAFVDEALDKMKGMLESNENLQTYIEQK